jgi:hypothetical protein
MIVDRTLRRNTKTTNTTRTIDTIIESCTSCTASRIVWLRSEWSVSFIARGTDACSWGSSANRRSDVATMFSPGSRLMTSITARRPLTSPIVRTSSSESITSATSRKRIAAPSWYAITRSRYCAACRS